MSFTIKAMMLVASVIAFLIIVLFITSFSGKTEMQQEGISFEMKASSNLQNLISKKECIAYDVGGKVQKGVIDANKLQNFASKYTDSEPNCSIDGESDYSVNVKEDRVNVSIYSRFPGDLEYLLKEIGGKKAIFVMDTSASMKEECGTLNDTPITKISCVGVFLNNFVDRLPDGSEIALMTYPGNLWDFMMTPVQGNREAIKNRILLSANGGTPMCSALKEAYRYDDLENVDEIVLLTDGCENSDECWIGDSLREVQKNLNRGIPVHTIAFGEDVEKCTYLLSEMANLTEGIYYRAKTCEDLAGRTPRYVITVQNSTWVFGVQQFSPEKAKHDQATITMPITIRHSSGTYRAGIIQLKAVDGELERIASAVNKLCNEGMDQKISISMKVTYPLTYSQGKLCVSSGGGICKSISCKVPVEFEEITSSGNYLIDVQQGGGKISVNS